MHPLVLFILATSITHFLVNFAIQIFRKWSSRRKFVNSRGCKPGKLEQKWDILGLRKILRATRAVLSGGILGYTDEIAATYGDTYASSFLGNRVIFTCDPFNIKQVLYIAPGTIAAVDGSVWKSLRTLWRLQFSALNNFFDIGSQEHHFQKFCGFIPSCQAIDIQLLLRDLMTDLMTDVALGSPIGALESEKTQEIKHLEESLRYVMERMAKDGFLGPASVLLGKKKQLEATEHVHRYVDQIILKKLGEKNNEQKPGKICVLDNLIKQTTNVAELRDLVLTLMIGANQTVGSFISTAIWVLATNPVIFNKLRAEILDLAGYDAPSTQQLKRFVYLNHFLLEVLRLYPPLPINARIANKDTWLSSGGGDDGSDPLLIKSGQCIVLSIWGSHRNRKTFGDDALEFKPERWETTKIDTPGYLPFLLGPRQCLGQHFAMLETTYIIVRLLQKYERIENNGNFSFKPELKLFLSQKDGVLVSFTPDSNYQS